MFVYSAALNPTWPQWSVSHATAAAAERPRPDVHQQKCRSNGFRHQLCMVIWDP